MTFDFKKETARTKELIKEFERAYIDGESDAVLTKKAKEIFGRIQTEDRNTKHGSEPEKAVRKMRNKFAKYVGSICDGRGPKGARELSECYAEHKTRHPED